LNLSLERATHLRGRAAESENFKIPFTPVLHSYTSYTIEIIIFYFYKSPYKGPIFLQHAKIRSRWSIPFMNKPDFGALAAIYDSSLVTMALDVKTVAC
jgi:hypothetical protein